MNIVNKVLIRLFCQKVGIDEFGNEYFTNKCGKRFVVYKGIAEPSKIPPYWHGWMHYTTSAPPKSAEKIFFWQKKHLPNLTGTKYAYHPRNSSSASSNTSNGYNSWSPDTKNSNN